MAQRFILTAPIAALTILASSMAQAAPAGSLSPLVALSAFGTVQSRAAVCAAGTAAVAAAAQAAPGPGCVLPAADAAPPPSVSSIPPAYVPPPAAGGPDILPLLLAVGAMAAAYLLLDDVFLGGDGLDIDLPESPF